MKVLWRRIKQLEMKNDVDQTKMDFYSVLVPTILSTDIFKKNQDIREVVELMKVKRRIGDYLFDNRTALLARLIREIERNDSEDLAVNIDNFKMKILELIEQKQLIDSSDVTKFINKYSRNKEKING